MVVSHRNAISFGMVHIPVGLYTATQDNGIHFNQLCKETVTCAKNLREDKVPEEYVEKESLS